MSDFPEMPILGHFQSLTNFKVLELRHVVYDFKALVLENQNILFVSLNI